MDANDSIPSNGENVPESTGLEEVGRILLGFMLENSSESAAGEFRQIATKLEAGGEVSYADVRTVEDYADRFRELQRWTRIACPETEPLPDTFDLLDEEQRKMLAEQAAERQPD